MTTPKHTPKHRSRKFTSTKYVLLLILLVLIVVSAALLVPKLHESTRSTHSDNAQMTRLQQIAYKEILKYCHEDAKKYSLDCASLKVNPPEREDGGNFFDPVVYSVSGGFKDKTGEMNWWSEVEIHSSGKILRGSVTYFDPATNEYRSVTKTLND